jgi:integrase
MAYITKRGNSYSVRYTYEDEHGKSCDKWESFPTKEEATNRKKQIEHELAAGTFLIPSSVTVAEFLMDWLPKQCSKHKWAPKTYESNLSTIQNLIIPYIGDMEMQKLRPYHMENLYTTLSKTPCGSYIEGKKQELTEKQKLRFLSGTTIHEVHRLLGTAFQYAVEWGILVKSPVPVDSPKKSTQERTIWTVEEMRAALDSMEDPILHLAVHLTLVGALREGEIVGLTPEDLDFDAADGIGTFRINKSMQRVRKEALNQVDDGCIIKVFPDKLERSTTSLIEEYQNGVFLPHHLHDLRTERGIEEVAESVGGRREERPGTLPRQRNAVPSAQRSGGGACADPQEVPQMAGCTPGVPAYRVPRSAALQCNLSVDDLRRRCEGCAGYNRSCYGGYAGEHLRPYPAVLSCGAGQEV